LIVLIAFRAIGISASRRKFSGLRFGSASTPVPRVRKIAGNVAVRRRICATPSAASTRPPPRRNGANSFSAMFIRISFSLRLFRPAATNKKAPKEGANAIANFDYELRIKSSHSAFVIRTSAFILKSLIAF
jgi:hypothetical protein